MCEGDNDEQDDGIAVELSVKNAKTGISYSDNYIKLI